MTDHKHDVHACTRKHKKKQMINGVVALVKVTCPCLKYTPKV